MSMTFADAEDAAPSTSLQRTQLLRKQAEQRGRPKSKKEIDAEAAAARIQALATALDSSNKGAKLMAKLGYKGGALGKSENARVQPIEVSMKGDRGGIGADSEKKRKLREHMESIQGKEKKQKTDVGEFRERNRREMEEKRQEGMMWGAMRIAEKLDTEAEEERRQSSRPDPQSGSPSVESTVPSSPSSSEKPKQAAPFAKANVLWRSLVVQRADRERERIARFGVSSSLSAFGQYQDVEEDSDDKIALGTEIEELEEPEDTELEQFNTLELAERLSRIVQYLRDSYHYCFWCKFRYPDAEMEGCPGTTEEEHD